MKYFSSVFTKQNAIWFLVVLASGFAFYSTSYAENGTGETIYAKHCGRCHDGGFLGWIAGAPKIGDKEVWKPLLGKGAEIIKTNTLKGVGRMDPKGGCAECSVADIEAAVDHMLLKAAPQH